MAQKAKLPWASKTIWVNVVTTLIAVLMLFTEQSWLPDEAGKWILMAVGVLNVLLRVITNQPISVPRISTRMWFLPAILGLCLTPIASAGEIVPLDVDTSRDGVYVLVVTVSGGVVSVVPAAQLVQVGHTSPGPNQPDDPADPNPTTLAAKVQQWTQAIDDPATAEKLLLGYETIAGQIKDGIFKSKAQVLAAQRRVNGMLARGDDRWRDWERKLEGELDALEAAGKLTDLPAMESAWREVVRGLDTAHGLLNPNREPRLDPEQRKQLIELIIKIVLLFLSGI